MGIFNKDKIIVRYAGGLGNQMFQYALRCNFIQKGKCVKDDISYYAKVSDAMPFRLTEVFPKIELAKAEEAEIEKYLKTKKPRNILVRIYNKLFPPKIKYYQEQQELVYDPKIEKIKSSYVSGYWQSFHYPENVKEELIKSFKFKGFVDEKIKELEKKIQDVNSVSVHIRAGDYLLPQNATIFGGICTIEYYQRAIALMGQKVKNPIFFIFSNDIEWCKNNFPLENVVWMDEATLPEHEDWEEMCLMSYCKHNIIANSSFSWWAAWLNQNPDKVIIAPQKWLQTVENDEICPRGWIRI